MKQLINLFSVVCSNLLGYDGLIIILGLINLFFIYFPLKKAAKTLNDKMNITVYAPHGKSSVDSAKKEISAIKENDILENRRDIGKKYSLFVNISSCFSLLGILGTVGSLMITVSGSSGIQENFYEALTSTFWGIVWSVIFKVLDAKVSPDIEECEKNVETFLENYSNNNDKDKNEGFSETDTIDVKGKNSQSGELP